MIFAIKLGPYTILIHIHKGPLLIQALGIKKGA